MKCLLPRYNIDKSQIKISPNTVAAPSKGTSKNKKANVAEPFAGALVGPTVETYQYDELSRITISENPEVKLEYKYDSLGRNLEEKYTIKEINQKYTVQKEYDISGNKTQIIYPSGRKIKRYYNPLSRLTRIEDQTNQLRQIEEYKYKGLYSEEVLYRKEV